MSKQKMYYFVACGHYMSPNFNSLDKAAGEFVCTVNSELSKDIGEQRTAVIYSASDVNSDYSIQVVKTWYPRGSVEQDH